MIKADDPDASDALHRLLWLYPEMPDADELKLDHAFHLERTKQIRSAIRVLRNLEVQTPSSDAGQRAHRRLRELRDSGVAVPSKTMDQIVLRATRLMRRGPLEQAKSEVTALVNDIGRFSPDQRGQINWLAGRLAQYEGRWKDAKNYLTRAQASPPEDQEQSSPARTSRQ